jgi:ABC-type branched-subunit amino acid transport system permease subunit
MPLLALTHHNGIRLAEVGFALAAVAGGILALGALSPAGRRAGTFLAGFTLAVGSVLLVVAVHWGHVG